MKGIAIGMVGAVAALVSAVPASAQSYGWQSHQAQEHDQLDAEHDETHYQLRDDHADAHQWGLNRREHGQVHRELRYEHRLNDQQLRQEHRRHDRNDRYRQYEYYGY